jgi:hypothetical protein
MQKRSMRHCDGRHRAMISLNNDLVLRGTRIVLSQVIVCYLPFSVCGQAYEI